MHPRGHGVQHFEVEAVPHTVGVDAVQADLPGPMLGAPGDPVQRIAAGILAPTLGKDAELAVHPLDVGGEDDALVAIALGCSRDQAGVLQRTGVDADLVGPALEHPVEILQRVDAAAHGQRDEDLARHLGEDIGEEGAALKAGRDVVEHQLIGPGGVVEPGHFHRVGHIPDALKVRALDHPAIPDIQTGNDAFCDHFRSPPFNSAPVLHNVSDPVPRYTGSCPGSRQRCPSFSVPTARLPTRCRRWP